MLKKKRKKLDTMASHSYSTTILSSAICTDCFFSSDQSFRWNLQNNHLYLKHIQKIDFCVFLFKSLMQVPNSLKHSNSAQNYLLACIRCKLIVFSSSLRNLTSAPYFPTVPSSTRMKWEWRLFRTFSLLNGFNKV